MIPSDCEGRLRAPGRSFPRLYKHWCRVQEGQRRRRHAAQSRGASLCFADEEEEEDEGLTEGCVELVQAEVAVVVVVVVAQQVLHGALQQAVLHVLLRRDLSTQNTAAEQLAQPVCRTARLSAEATLCTFGINVNLTFRQAEVRPKCVLLPQHRFRNVSGFIRTLSGAKCDIQSKEASLQVQISRSLSPSYAMMDKDTIIKDLYNQHESSILHVFVH